MSSPDDEVRYSVAWIDLVAKGRNLGRSVLHRGDHARLTDLDARQQITPLAYGPHQVIAVPPLVPPMGVLNHATVAAFNEFWYRKAPASAYRRDSRTRRLLPPTRPRRIMEPAVWQPRHGAVSIRRPVRRGRRTTHRRRAPVGQRRSELPRRAEAVRCCQPVAAQLSQAPAGRWPSTCPVRRVASATCCTASTVSYSVPVAVTTSPRTRI